MAVLQSAARSSSRRSPLCAVRLLIRHYPSSASCLRDCPSGSLTYAFPSTRSASLLIRFAFPLNRLAIPFGNQPYRYRFEMLRSVSPLNYLVRPANPFLLCPTSSVRHPVFLILVVL